MKACDAAALAAIHGNEKLFQEMAWLASSGKWQIRKEEILPLATCQQLIRLGYDVEVNMPEGCTIVSWRNA